MSKKITTIEYENALRIVREYEAQQLRSLIQEEIAKAVATLPNAPMPQDEIFTFEQAAEFLHLSVATLRSKASARAIPVNKRAGRLYFSKLDLISYLKGGRRMTEEEAREEARKNAEKWAATKMKK